MREAARRLAKHSGVDTRESTEMGLALLDLITGYHDLVIVDSIQTHENPPGSVLEIHPSGLKVLPRKSPHFFGVGEVLALGRNLELVVPERVVIFAVEVLDPFTVTEEMTPPLRQALPGLVDRVMARRPGHGRGKRRPRIKRRAGRRQWPGGVARADSHESRVGALLRREKSRSVLECGSLLPLWPGRPRTQAINICGTCINSARACDSSGRRDRF